MDSGWKELVNGARMGGIRKGRGFFNSTPDARYATEGVHDDAVLRVIATLRRSANSSAGAEHLIRAQKAPRNTASVRRSTTAAASGSEFDRPGNARPAKSGRSTVDGSATRN